MEKEFVTYDLALRMKALGFDKPCISAYNKLGIPHNIMYHNGITYKVMFKDNCLRPTWQSAFEWFREKYGLFPHIFSNEIGTFVWCIRWYIDNEQKDIPYNASLTYEEAELACLEKLIEIVEGYE